MNLQKMLCVVAVLLGLATTRTVNAAGAHSRKLAQFDLDIPTKGLVDVYLLADNTGSMGFAIADVKKNAVKIFDQISKKAPDVAFGVGAYRDVGDNFIFKNFLPITDLPKAFKTQSNPIRVAINKWTAQGGGDAPEAQLFALHQVAKNINNEIKWRKGAKRIIVWFGDAPGHDPRNGISEQAAIEALTWNEVQVVALELRSLDSTGQATRITKATNGKLIKVTDQTTPPNPCRPFPPPRPIDTPFATSDVATLAVEPTSSSVAGSTFIPIPCVSASGGAAARDSADLSVSDGLVSGVESVLG